MRNLCRDVVKCLSSDRMEGKYCLRQQFSDSNVKQMNEILYFNPLVPGVL